MYNKIHELVDGVTILDNEEINDAWIEKHSELSVMNKNILDLAMQSNLYADLKGTPWPRLMGAKEFNVSHEKFAELLIEECCKMMIQLEIKYPANLTVKEIRKHFGLK